jgi:orotidine-5'-phosphate decarboxylase
VTKPFSDRLAAAVRDKNSRLVVGLDPHLHLLPPELTDGISSDDREGLAGAAKRFCVEIVTAVQESTVAVKPQVAFFERLGPPGYQALEEVVEAAHGHGLLVISDGKRGDIGSTAQAYADYHLGDGGGPAALGADCATVNPYLGEDSLQPYESYLDRGRGIFLIAKTSNRGSGDLQDKIVGNGGATTAIYTEVARMAERIGARHELGVSGYGSAGIVVGATYPEQGRALREAFPSLIFLVPGIGAQGAAPEEIAGCFDGDGFGALINASRSVLFAYRDDNADGKSWRDAACDAAVVLRDEINAVLPPVA